MEPSAREVFVPPQPAADTSHDHDDRQCRICLENGGPDLIAPCLCSGTGKWVHRRCLDRWRADGSGPNRFTHCPNCQFAYVLVATVDSTESEQRLRERRRRLLKRAVGNFFWGALMLQAGLTVVAVLIRLIDRKELLVDLLPFLCAKGQGQFDDGTFFSTLRYHKSTYYFAAMVVCFALIGVSLLALLLCRGCTPRARGIQPNICPNDPECVYLNCRACEACGQCCGDCCEVCLRGDNRCCDCNCEESCCRECPEVRSNSSSNSNSIAAACIIIVMALALLGVVFALMALVTWIQKVIERYFQLQELQQMAIEYVVKDLAAVDLQVPPASAPSLQEMQTHEPSAPPDLESPRHMWHPTTDAAVQRVVTQDLQAVYGIA
eukprot:TRINITY_DN79097_c0_g1_i1.p1 TRINITY_DN79097_c0_g1~~TRINITY_DN79097_c0_g1_i1.p1  ORF type:complete len:400 (+),score=52.60 TRINITY_DN79097_c0_g1_i1:67-1200(+)